VGWKGRAIVIPGQSQSGKTTLVSALIRAGATYYSDEFAVFDKHGRVHPHPRPLSVREGTPGRSRRYPLKALGGVPGDKPLPVGLVVFTRYKPDKKWRPRRLSPGQAVLALVSHTLPARRRPRATLTTLKQVVAGARTLRGVRGEADQVAEALLGACEK